MYVCMYVCIMNDGMCLTCIGHKLKVILRCTLLLTILLILHVRI